MAKAAGETPVTLTLSNTDFTFNVNRTAYNDYLNNLMVQKNKVGASNNFLVTVIDESQREELVALIEKSPGSELEIAGAITEAYSPDLGLAIKK